MAKLRKVITRINRYLLLEEAQIVAESLSSNNYNYKLHKISDYSYMIELLNIDKDDRKKLLKEELNKLDFTIYKTDKTLKELKEIQQGKEEVPEEA